MNGAVYTLSYDAENRLTAISGGTSAAFMYDADGNRVKGTVGGVTTTYIGNYLEWTGSTSTMKKYYYAGSTRVAMRVGSSTMYFLLSDHLGGTAITADSNGGYFSEVRYSPYGATRYTSGTTPTSFRFTGQWHEAAIGGTVHGLYFYNARWYDPALGRFVSADTLVPSPQNPQSLNRYAYVLNNPLRYTDPTGHVACSGISECVGGSTLPLPTPISDDGDGSRGSKGAGSPTTTPRTDKGHQPPPPFQGGLCNFLPALCQGKPLNPLAYDTWGMVIPFKLKLGGGIEATFIFLVNGKSIKEFDFQNFDGGLFVNYQVSAGISAMDAAGVGVIGANGSVLDQLGMSFLDGNLAGCLPNGLCGGASGSIDSNGNPQSIQYFVGAGEGFDVSVGKSVTDFGLYVKGDTVTAKLPLAVVYAVIPIPFLNQTWTFNVP